MEEVVNRRPCKDIEALYGSKLTRHLLMARVNLILAICSTIHDLPELLAAGIISVLSYYYRQLQIINLHNTLLNYFLKPTELSESQEKRSSTSCLPDVSSSDESSGLQLIARKLTLGEFKVLHFTVKAFQLSFLLNCSSRSRPIKSILTLFDPIALIAVKYKVINTNINASTECQEH